MIGWLLFATAAVVVGFVLLSPLESLRWWTDRGQREVRATFALDAVPAGSSSSTAYLCYLSGVGTLGGDCLSKREQRWLDSLRAALPEVQVIGDVFPYAVDNRGLLQRATMWWWARLERMRRSRWPGLLPLLINLRNISKVLVSADPRYGPAMNIGLAQEIWRALRRHGYAPGSPVPVYLVGLSGGAQMALGASTYLSALGATTSVISIGGIFSDDPGLDRIQHLWQLNGAADRMRHLGNIAFPGRWPIAPLSAWGKAQREGRVTSRTIGPMGHDGAGGYLGHRAFDEDGRSYAELTEAAVVGIVTAGAGTARPDK
ncbi:MAG: hypothetical protein ACK5KO_08095 [Arachnia sp.]